MKRINRLKTAAVGAIKLLFLHRLSVVGLFLAVNFAGNSLTPSLMPRTWLFQGIVTGISLAVGYLIGVIIAAVWKYLQLPELQPGTIRNRVVAGLAVFNGASLGIMFAQTGSWQNRVRELVGVEPSQSTYILRIIFVGLLVFTVLLIAARLIRIVAQIISRFTHRYIPKRAGYVLTGFILLWLFGSVATGAFRSTGLRIANNVFSVADRGIKEGSTEPTSPLRSAGPESLVTWDDLGQQGKQFVGSGPTIEDLRAVSPAAKEPIRVYASLKNGESHAERAKIALNELLRTNAFDREYLLLTTTTGTGYLDPNAVDSFEYVGAGDTAIVGIQYSYLPSWLAILSDTETPKDAAVALFNEVHGYWQTLNPVTRPELHLYGLSLGAYGSQASISRVELLNDPVDGALWAGPPFVSEFWNRVVNTRDEGSPSYLPTYQGGEVIRFTDGEKELNSGYSEQWQENKIVYLQYPTDPVVFFSNDYVLSEPSWLQNDRGRGVSEDFEWRPFVTYFQLAFDLISAGSSAEGYGHLYSADDYVDSWSALLGRDSNKQVILESINRQSAL